MAKLLEGKIVADKIQEDLKNRVRSLKSAPVLASILVGDNSSAVAYVKAQAKVAQGLGITYQLHQLAESISEDALIDFVLKLNADNVALVITAIFTLVELLPTEFQAVIV